MLFPFVFMTSGHSPIKYEFITFQILGKWIGFLLLFHLHTCIEYMDDIVRFGLYDLTLIHIVSYESVGMKTQLIKWCSGCRMLVRSSVCFFLSSRSLSIHLCRSRHVSCVCKWTSNSSGSFIANVSDYTLNLHVIRRIFLFHRFSVIVVRPCFYRRCYVESRFSCFFSLSRRLDCNVCRCCVLATLSTYLLWLFSRGFVRNETWHE